MARWGTCVQVGKFLEILKNTFLKMFLPGLVNNYEDLSAVKDAVEGTQQAGANGVKPGRKAFRNF